MKKYKAFTLLEVLVASLVLGFLGVGAIFMIANSNRILNAGVKMSMVNSNMQTVMRDISKDVKGGFNLYLDGNGLIVKYINNAKIKWYTDDGNLIRVDSSGTKKNILFFGAKDIDITATFKPDTSGLYHKAEVEFSMLLDDGNTFEVGNVTNTYYCRLRSDGF